MGALYKESKEVKTSVKIEREGDIIKLLFTSDCGKHGTDEILDSFELTAEEILEVLQMTFIKE